MFYLALDGLWGDILAACRDDQVFLSVDDEDETVTVNLCDVARVEESLLVEDFGAEEILKN